MKIIYIFAIILTKKAIIAMEKAFETLEKHGVNVNKFIRQAISEKIKSDWRKIKEPTTKEYCPF